MNLTVGDLTAAHIGATLTLAVPDDPDGEPWTGDLTRVQHHGPTVDPLGRPIPAQTLLSVSGWSGSLNPTHPITITEA